jgi:SMODS and SLOG-associating 2TM effector domain 2
MEKKPKDLAPNEFPKIAWQQGKLAEPLGKLFDCVVKEANDSIQWYTQRRKPKQLGGQILRVGAIVFAAIAGLVPVVGEIFQDGNGRPGIPPGWATVALGIAGLLVLLDRFWGFTSAWVRFMLSQQELGEALSKFEFEWEQDKISWEGQEPTVKQASAMIANCKAFMLQIHAIVRRETNMWAAEFQSVVAMVDQNAKIAAQVKEPGAIMVQVTNGDQCQDGWKLTIDDGSAIAYSGTSAALPKIQAGIRTIRVVGTINGVERRAAKSVSIVSGGVENIELTLT